MSEVEVLQMIKDYSDSIFDWSIISFLYGAVVGFAIHSLIDELFDLIKNRKNQSQRMTKNDRKNESRPQH